MATSAVIETFRDQDFSDIQKKQRKPDQQQLPTNVNCCGFELQMTVSIN